MENIINCVHNYGWHDCSLESILIEYDRITVNILNREEHDVRLICENFIGINYVGQWDENIIKDIRIKKNTDLTRKALDVIRNKNRIDIKGGGEKIYTAPWYDVDIQLIDEIHIHICCMGIQATV